MKVNIEYPWAPHPGFKPTTFSAVGWHSTTRPPSCLWKNTKQLSVWLTARFKSVATAKGQHISPCLWVPLDIRGRQPCSLLHSIFILFQRIFRAASPRFSQDSPRMHTLSWFICRPQGSKSSFNQLCLPISVSLLVQPPGNWWRLHCPRPAPWCPSLS